MIVRPLHRPMLETDARERSYDEYGEELINLGIVTRRQAPLGRSHLGQTTRQEDLLPEIARHTVAVQWNVCLGDVRGVLVASEPVVLLLALESLDTKHRGGRCSGGLGPGRGVLSKSCSHGSFDLPLVTG